MGFQPVLGVFGRRNLVLFVHKVVFGASGVLSSQDAAADSGVVLGARISAGRYKATLPSVFRVFHGGWSTVLGPDTAVYGAKTTGNNFVLRANKVDANTPDGTVLVQWLNPSTDATNYIDADVPDNLTAFLFFVASR